MRFSIESPHLIDNERLKCTDYEHSMISKSDKIALLTLIQIYSDITNKNRVHQKS